MEKRRVFADTGPRPCTRTWTRGAQLNAKTKTHARHVSGHVRVLCPRWSTTRPRHGTVRFPRRPLRGVLSGPPRSMLRFPTSPPGAGWGKIVGGDVVVTLVPCLLLLRGNERAGHRTNRRPRPHRVQSAFAGFFKGSSHHFGDPFDPAHRRQVDRRLIDAATWNAHTRDTPRGSWHHTVHTHSRPT